MQLQDLASISHSDMVILCWLSLFVIESYLFIYSLYVPVYESGQFLTKHKTISILSNKTYDMVSRTIYEVKFGFGHPKIFLKMQWIFMGYEHWDWVFWGKLKRKESMYQNDEGKI